MAVYVARLNNPLFRFLDSGTRFLPSRRNSLSTAVEVFELEARINDPVIRRGIEQAEPLSGSPHPVPRSVYDCFRIKQDAEDHWAEANVFLDSANGFKRANPPCDWWEVSYYLSKYAAAAGHASDAWSAFDRGDCAKKIADAS